MRLVLKHPVPQAVNLTFKGNFLGFAAVFMWGLLPLLRLQAGEIPALQLAWMSFFTAAAAALFVHRRQSPKKGLLQGVRVSGGAVSAAGFLLGAVALYFAALSQGPAAEITLVTYLWPLGLAAAGCISSSRLPNGKMCLGLLMAFGGTALALFSGKGAQGLSGVSPELFAGCVLGLAAGSCWLGYSLLIRQLPQDFGLQTGKFALAGLGAGMLHMVVEGPSTVPDSYALLAALIIGLGPYGLAFIFWGYGLRYGQTQVLSALCYCVPVIAAGSLILAGAQAWRWELAASALAVACGAWLAGNEA